MFIEKKPQVFAMGPSVKLTFYLIGACILVYFYEMYINFTEGLSSVLNLFTEYGFSTVGILAGQYWTFITSIFIHAGPEHLILNMLALFFFGRVVEESIGWRKTLLVFLGGGVIGNLAVFGSSFLGIMPMDIPTVGASGAIFCLMGMAMLIKPLEFVFYPYIVPVPLILVAVLYTLFNIGDFIAVLLTGNETTVAYISHIGGLFLGMFLGFKQEGSKKGLQVLLLILLVLVIVPLIWEFIQYLEMTNYISLLTQAFS